MIEIKQAIVVEGRYDKIKLSSIVNGLIIELGGFQIFKDVEKLVYIKQLAKQMGIVILTDSDAAGFQIRAKLSSCIPKEQIYHAYIPDVFGKERRKFTASSEGKLGVEGVSAEAIIAALRQSGVVMETEERGETEKLTQADLFALGLVGRSNSKSLRMKVLNHLNLPERMGTKAMIQAINRMYGFNKGNNMLEKICMDINETMGESPRK